MGASGKIMMECPQVGTSLLLQMEGIRSWTILCASLSLPFLYSAFLSPLSLVRSFPSGAAQSLAGAQLPNSIQHVGAPTLQFQDMALGMTTSKNAGSRIAVHMYCFTWFVCLYIWKIIYMYIRFDSGPILVTLLAAISIQALIYLKGKNISPTWWVGIVCWNIFHIRNLFPIVS